MKCQGLATGFLESACANLIDPARCDSNIFCTWNGAGCMMTHQEAEGNRICAAQLDITMCQKKAMCTYVGGMCMLKQVVKIEIQLACSVSQICQVFFKAFAMLLRKSKSVLKEPEVFISIRMTLGTIQNDYFIMWDMFETHSEPSDRWKIFS